MPYRRRYRRRFRPRRSNRNAYSMARKALYKASKLQKNVELKHNAIAVADTGPSSTGAIQELSILGQGDTNTTRTGDRITGTSIKMRCKLTLHASATASQVRVILFQWKSGSPTAITEILTSAAMQAFKSEDNRYESKILYDRVFNLNTDRPETFFQIKRKVRSLIAYPGSTTAANRNSIWIATLSDEAVNVPVLAATARMYFKDT